MKETRREYLMFFGTEQYGKMKEKLWKFEMLKRCVFWWKFVDFW
jgi:hypothetical protein